MKYTLLVIIFAVSCAKKQKDFRTNSAGAVQMEESKKITAEEALQYKSDQEQADLKSKIAAQEHDIEAVGRLNEIGLEFLEISFRETVENMQTYNEELPQADFTKFLEMADGVKTMHDLQMFAGFAFTKNDDEVKDSIIDEAVRTMQAFYQNQKQYDSVVKAKESVVKAKKLIKE